MIADLKPYAEYKESSIDWQDNLPRHWQELPLRRLAAIENSGCYGGEPEERAVVLPVATTAQIDRDGNFAVERMPSRSFTQFEANRYRCRAGDILVVKSSGSAANVISGKAGIVTATTQPFVFSNFLMRVVPRPQVVHPEFLYLLLVSNLTRERVKRMVSTTTYPNLRVGEYCSALLPSPPPAEQAAIVRFLDWANGRLERAIRAKRKVIALLGEQKQAIIHRAVTRSLDPSVPLKPSGIPWLGDIPQHWEAKKLRFLFRYAKGNRAAELTNEYIGGNAGPFPVYSGQTEFGGLMGTINWHEFEFPSPVVFVSTVGARAMTTRLVQGRFSLSQNCALIIPRRSDVDVIFFESVFQRLFAFERASISLIMQPSLRFADLNRFYVPQPPYEEQQRIAGAISREVSALHTAISRLEREIEL